MSTLPSYTVFAVCAMLWTPTLFGAVGQTAAHANVGATTNGGKQAANLDCGRYLPSIAGAVGTTFTQQLTHAQRVSFCRLLQSNTKYNAATPPPFGSSALREAVAHTALGSDEHKRAVDNLAQAIAAQVRARVLHYASMYTKAYDVLTPTERKVFPSLFAQARAKNMQNIRRQLAAHPIPKETPDEQLGLLGKLNLTGAQRSAILGIMNRNVQLSRQIAKGPRPERVAFTYSVPSSAKYQTVVNNLAKAEARAAYADELRAAKMHAQIYDVLAPSQRAQLAQLKAKRHAQPKQ